MFNWHPLLNTFGFLLLCESVGVYRQICGGCTYKMQMIIHAILNFLSLACFIAAVIMVHRYHSAIDVEHFYSVHSWIGLTSLFLLTLNFVAGILMFFFPKFDVATRLNFVPLHKWIGSAAFVSVFATVLMGLLNKQSLIPATDPFDSVRTLPNILALLIFLNGVATLGWLGAASPVSSPYKELPAAAEDRDEAE